MRQVSGPLIDKPIQNQYNSCMASKTFNISLPEELVKKIDEQAKKEFTSRSDFLRNAALTQLNAKQAKSTKLADEYEAFVEQYGQTLKNLKDR